MWAKPYNQVLDQKGKNMTPGARWILAILLAVVLIAISVAVFYVGGFLGLMATDSCSDLPDYASYYVFILWPIVLLATSLTAPILIVRQARWRWVWISLGTGIILSTCCILSWFVYLMFGC
jgi:hypothetical protein